MILFLLSRSLWFLSCLGAVAASVVYFIPFTYQQVIRANLFPEVSDFAPYFPILVTVASLLMGVSVVLNWQTQASSRGRTAVLAAALLFPAFASCLEIVGLPTNGISWILAFTGALLMMGPSLNDLANACRENFESSYGAAESRDKDFQLFVSLLLTSTAAMAISYSLEEENWAESLMTVFLVAMIVHGVLTFAFRLAERAKHPLRAEWMLSVFLLGFMLYQFLSGWLFPALAYAGFAQKFLSAALAFGAVLPLMAMAPKMLGSRSRKGVTGLQILIAPLALRSRWRLVPFIAAIGFAVLTGWLIPIVATLDWNFLGQKSVFLFGTLLVFANFQWSLTVKSPRWFRTPYPFVAGLAALAVFDSVKDPVLRTNPKSDVVLTIAKSVLSSDESGSNEAHYKFLQESSNIPKSVRLTAPDFRLTADAGPDGLPAPTKRRKYDVIMIVIDSLRPDYLTAYNPDSRITPFINEFSKDAVVFRKAFTSYGATGLSEPSIWVGGRLVHQQYVTPFYPMNNLQKMLDADGYQALISMDSILSQILHPSANVTELDPGVSTQDLDLCATLPRLRNLFLEKRGLGPVFAYTQAQNIHISVLGRKGRPVAENKFPGFYAPYAEALHRLDRCFGQFIQALKNNGLYDDTILVFTADHGDSLGEDGRFGHAYTVFPEIMKIPMIVHLPQSLRDQWDWDADRLAFSTDLTPSLYALMGHELAPQSWIIGQSLFRPKGGRGLASVKQESYLLASSYGAVYALLDSEATQLFISDAVNFTNLTYDLRVNPPVLKQIGADEKLRNERLIRSRIKDINTIYGFKGPQDAN